MSGTDSPQTVRVELSREEAEAFLPEATLPVSLKALGSGCAKIRAALANQEQG